MKRNGSSTPAQRLLTWEEVSWVTGISIEHLMAIHKQETGKVTVFRTRGHKRSVSQPAVKVPASALAGRP